MEVIGAAAITAAVSYLVVFLRYANLCGLIITSVTANTEHTDAEYNRQNLLPTSSKNVIPHMATSMVYATRQPCGRMCSCSYSLRL